MAQPTIEKRLQRKFIVMSTDVDLIGKIKEVAPGWDVTVITDLSEIGDWHEILLYRFFLLDLDETEAFDPVGVMQDLRTQHMLQIAVFCFGGDKALREEMRLARADRFYEREEIIKVLPQFLAQYAWGG